MCLLYNRLIFKNIRGAFNQNLEESGIGLAAEMLAFQVGRIHRYGPEQWTFLLFLTLTQFNPANPDPFFYPVHPVYPCKFRFVN